MKHALFAYNPVSGNRFISKHIDFIIEKLHRSATVENAHGAYSNANLNVIMTVLTRREASLLRNFLHTTDSHAFITIVNSSEIIGKGFRSV